MNWNLIRLVIPFGTMPQWVIRSAYPSFTTGKCALMQAVKQPEHGTVLITEDWNILCTDELRSKFNFVRFNCRIKVMQCFPFLTLLQYILHMGGSNFWLPPPEGGIWKILKRGWKYGAGAGLLKRGCLHFSYLIFSRFIIFIFRNYFTFCKIVLCIWRKIIFFCNHNFMKKGHSKLSKNEPENIP